MVTGYLFNPEENCIVIFPEFWTGAVDQTLGLTHAKPVLCP